MNILKGSLTFINVLLLVNIILILQQAYFYLTNDQFSLFQALATFLCLERFITLLFVTVNLDKWQFMVRYLILNVLFMGWQGLGFTIKSGEQYFEDKLLRVQIKKSVQFLNSIPFFIQFYHLASYSDSQHIPLLFIVSIIYGSILVGTTITQRQIDRKTEHKLTNCLYFLSNCGAMVSYWGLLGQIFYKNGCSAILIVLVVSLLGIIIVYRERSPCVWLVFLLKQIFLVKQVDFLSKAKLSQSRYQSHQQSYLQALTHIVLFTIKFIQNPYQNFFDAFIYLGTLLRCIEFVKIIQNIYSMMKYGPYSYNTTINLSDENLEETIKILKQKKLVQRLNLSIQVEDITQQQISDRQLSMILNIINIEQFTSTISFVKNSKTLHCSLYSNDTEIVANNIVTESHIELIYRVAMSCEGNRKSALNIIPFYYDQSLTRDSELARLALKYLRYPMQLALKRNYYQTELVHNYNSCLQSFVLQTTAFQHHIMDSFNINPYSILYDLYEDH